MVMKFLSSAALAASLALAVPALAAPAPTGGAAPSTDTPSAATPSGATPSTPAAQSGAQGAGAANATTAGANASATVGMSVNDNTGATIGQITAIGPDSTGKNRATIKMGAKSFAVDPSALAVQGGAATINVTKAQIEQQLPKP
jgi:hypothetical protein